MIGPSFRRRVVFRFAVRLLGIVAASFLPGSGLRADEPGPDVSQMWQTWFLAAKSELEVPDAGRLHSLRQQLEHDVGHLESRLAGFPNGQILRREWNLPGLSKALKADPPSADELKSIERALQGRGPTELQSLLNELRARVIVLAQLAELQTEPNATTILYADLERLAAYAAQRDPSKVVRQHPADVLESYARLQRLNVVPSRLDEFRRAASFPNELVMVQGKYVSDVSRRAFHIPLNFATQQDETTVTGSGNAVAVASAALIPDREHGQLQIIVNGTGQLALHAQRTRASLDASAAMGLNAYQTMRLGPEGVSSDRPQIGLANDLQLQNVTLNVRSPVIRNLLTRIASRIASRLLDEKEGQIAAQGGQTMEDRIADESYDIAYRINGLFHRAYWRQLAGSDIHPRWMMHSTSEELVGTIEHGHPWDLAAPSPPPAFPAPRSDIEVFVHESAINNEFATLAGRWFDESTYRELAIEEFKLASRAAQPGPGRIPAAIRFADHEPLRLAVGDRRITMTVRISACRWNGLILELPETALDLSYSVALAPTGLELTRDQLRIQPDGGEHVKTLALVIPRYFPERAGSAPRFRNESFQPSMEIKHVHFGDGWIGIGMKRLAAAN